MALLECELFMYNCTIVIVCTENSIERDLLLCLQICSWLIYLLSSSDNMWKPSMRAVGVFLYLE